MSQENEIVESTSLIENIVEGTSSIDKIDVDLQNELKVISFITVVFAITMIWLDNLMYGKGTLAIASLIISAGCYNVASDVYNHKHVQDCTLLNFITLVLCGIVVIPSLFIGPSSAVAFDLNLFFSALALLCWGGFIAFNQRKKD